jgi:hypothetical protein
MKHVLAFAVIAGLGLPAHAVQINLTPSKDNTLFEILTGDLSNGLGSLFAGVTAGNTKHRAVLAFDFSSVPSNAIINSASLQLNVSKAGAGGASVFSLYPLTADWGEGTSNSGSSGSGITAAPGDATWTHRFYNTSIWSTDGGDFSAAPSGSLSMGAIGSYSISGAGMAGAVQAWVASPASNFGWILKSDETVLASSLRFDSRESLASSTRPTLSIDYTVPSSASSWIGDSDGSWTDSARWSAGVPNSSGAEAIFGPVISTTRTVTVSSPQTIGTLTIDSPQTYRITGTATLNFNASDSNVYLNVMQGIHDIETPVSVAGGKELRKTGAGAASVMSESIDALRLEGGTLALLSDSGQTSMKSLAFAGGKLDVRIVTLALDDGVASQRSFVRSALSAGSISSSTMASGFAVGYVDVSTTRVDVRNLLLGDANANGKVDTADFNLLAGAFGSSDQFWGNGDFDYDGVIGSTDFNAMVGNWGRNTSSTLLGSVVPEPGMVGAAGSAVILLLRRDRRRSQGQIVAPAI